MYMLCKMIRDDYIVISSSLQYDFKSFFGNQYVGRYDSKSILSSEQQNMSKHYCVKHF